MRPIIFDGAFGTYYHKTSARSEPCELANIDDRDAVYQIHKEYIDAGVDAIKTNTFGANRVNFPDETIRNRVIRSGFDLAVTVAKSTPVLVFADIGYFNPESLADSAADEYRSIAEQFVQAGATRFVFETLAELEPILPAIRWIKNTVPDAFILVSFAVSQDGYTRKGLFYKTLMRQACKNPDVDVCGLNCICGPNHILELLRDADVEGKPLCAMPNSGYPATIGGRTVFRDNAAYFADKLRDLRRAGAEYLGGCCGTTPEHMRQAVLLLRDSSAAPSRTAVSKAPAETINISPRISTNLFRDKLDAGKRVIAVELDPPMDADVSFLLLAAQKAKDAGADIVTITDSPLARTRADSILLAAKVKREVGIDAIPHLSCRDRNHIALKACILGAAIENINNILVVTGDPIAQTDRGEMKGVFSYNSFQLIAFVKSLNEEVLQDSPFMVAAALNVNSARFTAELRRAQNKIEQGADLFLTQPLYSDESIRNAVDSVKYLQAPVLFGIMPVASYKNAMFLNNEVAGIDIPDDFIAQLNGRTQQEVEERSLEFCMDIVQKTKGAANGYYLVTPLKKIDLVCELVRRIQTL